MRTFIEVVRQGSCAAAALRLDLAPSQVTRAVAALETELGARLMHRTTRKPTLSESGAAYFRRVSELMDELDVAADDVRVRHRSFGQSAARGRGWRFVHALRPARTSITNR